jgi:hypothetical protein
LLISLLRWWQVHFVVIIDVFHLRQVRLLSRTNSAIAISCLISWNCQITRFCQTLDNKKKNVSLTFKRLIYFLLFLSLSFKQQCVLTKYHSCWSNQNKTSYFVGMFVCLYVCLFLLIRQLFLCYSKAKNLAWKEIWFADFRNYFVFRNLHCPWPNFQI